jgi:hypothetical protein
MVLSFCASVAKRVDSVDNCPKVGTIDHGRSPRTGLATIKEQLLKPDTPIPTMADAVVR